VLLSTCAYVLVAVSVISGAFIATMALTHGEGASATGPQVSVGKIGPGYARMQPVNLGKPEKIVASTPYDPHRSTPTLSRVKQTAQRAIPAPPALPPIMIAESAKSGPPDIHRIY
jgi:hypothetical protein